MKADELLNCWIKQTQYENPNLGRDTVEVDEKDDLDTTGEDF